MDHSLQHDGYLRNNQPTMTDGSFGGCVCGDMMVRARTHTHTHTDAGANKHKQRSERW
jgi:hypothetical protein